MKYAFLILTVFLATTAANANLLSKILPSSWTEEGRKTEKEAKKAKAEKIVAESKCSAAAIQLQQTVEFLADRFKANSTMERKIIPPSDYFFYLESHTDLAAADQIERLQLEAADVEKECRAELGEDMFLFCATKAVSHEETLKMSQIKELAAPLSYFAIEGKDFDYTDDNGEKKTWVYLTNNHRSEFYYSTSCMSDEVESNALVEAGLLIRRTSKTPPSTGI